ncbi:NHLP bacteriocin export ABC transporter permease/ATPase subunit [Azospirillum thermophilum]|uniref:NHLP bacteriocin export ABC transporter permease/ATPase subunit n=1 Tax=Azospirillum thermophilum TaxID=2202148 RepID=A0A2S2CWJ9_9PROT|nr:NHLP bacteriocin export ABC transporter permease/ATPase subunit [Azospirillum thermophilum]AWK88785.1 NHLP bacteriocin export ABC transporter permease/ATPase subunit [Azospirillum thermophilum]
MVAASQGLSRLIVPRPRIPLIIAPGEGCRLHHHQRLGCNRGVAWARFDGAPPLFLDSEEVFETAAGTALPLCAASWATAGGTCTVTSSDTLSALADGSLWPALAAFHRLMLEALPLNLRLAAVDEFNRLRERASANENARIAAAERLAMPLGRAARREAAEVGADPLARAVAAVAGALGHRLTPPALRRDREGGAPTLEEILRVNRLRHRRVVLDEGWWRADCGPILLIRAADSRPLALLRPASANRYLVYDPVEDVERPLSAAEARDLAGEAFSFYAPLPFRPLRGLDIGFSAFRFSLSDVLALVGFGLVGALLGMGVPMATGFLVDTIIPAHDLPRLWEMVAVLLVVAATLLVTRYAAQIALVRIEGRSGTRIQAAVIDRLLRLPVGFFKQFTSGDLARRALAISTIEQAVNGTLTSTLLNALFALSALGLMAWHSVKLALVGLGLIVLLMAVTLVLGLLRVKHERLVMEATGETAGLMLQLANGIAKLRLAAAEDRAFLRWARSYARFSRQRFLADQVGNLMAMIAGLYGPLATAALFGMIYYLGLADGALGLGAVLAFLSAFGQALSGMTGLSNAIVQIAALKPVYAYAAPILRAVPEVTEDKADPGELSGAIELSHVAFAHGDSPPLFEDLSLSIAAGEYVAVVGPSGCGKSTMLRLMLGFETPSAGAVLYDGCDLASLDVQAVRRQCGVVLQGGQLMPGSLLDNILGAHTRMQEADAWEAARLVGLEDDIRAMPMGMQTVIADAGGTLSGGQVQRVLIARAIIARPRILMFDEATSALDNRTQAVVTGSIDHFSATRIVIAHRLSTVINADRIIVLRDGRVEESGSYAELSRTGGFFAQMMERQLL